MSDALEGEIVTPGARLPKPTGRDRAAGIVTSYLVYAVDLPNGGRIEGMDRADALRVAAQLGTRAWEAGATLYRTGLVVVTVPRPI